MTLRNRHRLLWGLALAVTVLGGALCLGTGRTAAHALTISLAAAFLAGAVHLADAFLPNEQSRRVRLLSAGMFAAAWAALFSFYAWHFSASQTVYVNDDALYYYQQLVLSQHLNDGLAATLRFVYQSISTDYTYVPNLFIAPLFSLTDRSIHGFALAGLLMTWTPLMYQLRRLTLRLADQTRLSGAGTLLLCAGTCVSVIALPLLHRAAAWCQINLLGLPILVQVVFLSWGTDFRRMQPVRLLCLFLCVALLTLTRRWFIFFLAGWLLLWGLSTVLRLLRQRDWRALRNLLLYGASCTALGFLLLWPLFSRALQGHYSVSYAFWRKDGSAFLYELCNQSWLLGWGSCGLISLGYAWGLCQRRSRVLRGLSAGALASALLSIFLFTRIQNMTYHQATILMPAYVLGLMLFFAMLARLRRRHLRIGATAAACAALLVQWGLCITHEEPQRLSPILSHVSLKPPVRDDIAALEAVSAFVAETCDAEHPALFLCNSSEFDRLTFVSLRYPDLSMRDKVALDRIALPSDGFPRAWFSARYIFVPTVVQTSRPGGTVEKLTHYLLSDEADRFEAAASFSFEGFDLLVMQRKGPVQYEEVEELMALFAQEHALYPKVYGDRIGYFYGLTLE